MVTDRPSPHSTRKRLSWQEGAAAALLLLLLTLIYFWPQVAQRRALYWGDIGLYFTPMTQFLHDNLRQGRLPLWNPLMLCGAPYVGNPQTWPLYPTSALLPFVPAPYFLSLTVAIHVWLAGVGTYLFLRRVIHVAWGPALAGAMTFMFGGWLVSKEQFPNMVQATAYLPWALLTLDALLTARRAARLRAAARLGVVFGLQILAAHAQMALLTIYLAAAWAVFRLVFDDDGGPRTARSVWRRLRPLLGPVLLAAVIAVGLSAGQVLPDMQMFRDGWRQDMSFHIVNRFYLPLNQMANWVLPALHGHPFYGNFTARGNFWETCCYVGWAAFVLAIIGVVATFARGGAPSSRFWIAVFIVAVLLALGGGAGSRSGPYWLAYHVLPGFRSFHDPARCLSWASFAAAVLAALGLQRIRRHVRRGGVLLLLLVIFADLAHFGQTLYPLADPATLFPVTPTIAAVEADPAIAAHQARFLAPDSARVWERFSGHKDYREHAPGYLSLWADTLTPNLPMAYGLSDAYGYEPVTRKDAQTVLGKLEAAFGPDATPPERAHAAADAGLVGVRWVATDRVRPPGASLPGLAPLFSDPSLPSLTPGREHSRVSLSQNSFWQPRARVVGLTNGRERPLGTAEISEDSPDRVAITVVNARPAELILADTCAPGWQAALDGRPAPIARNDGFLRAVRLASPGRRVVVFVYRPATFLLGLYLTLLTIAALVGAAAFRVSSYTEEPLPALS